MTGTFHGRGTNRLSENAVADILRSTKDWRPASFADYGEERRERMRRLRIGARLVTDIRTTFSPLGVAPIQL
jgi:hypothetical protein